MKFDRRDFLKILPVAPTIISAAETKSYRGMSDSAGCAQMLIKGLSNTAKTILKLGLLSP